MPRSKRVISKTGIYYIFATAELEKKLTNDDADKKKLVLFFNELKNEIDFEIFAFSVTNNEFHCVIREKNELDISIIMKIMITRYLSYYNNKYDKKGGILHDRFKSVPLVNKDEIQKYIRYVHQVPVKIFEYQNVFSYGFSSYRDFFSDEPKFISSNAIFLWGNDLKKARLQFKYYHASLEVDELKGMPRRKLTIEDMRQIMINLTNVEYSKFEEMNKEDRYRIATKIKRSKKLSYRQMEKLLHISRGTLIKL